MDWLQSAENDIVCLQETKCTDDEAAKVMPGWVDQAYPYRYWNSCDGRHQDKGFQKKGLSGTAIWSKRPGIQLAGVDFDKEGRITAVEFSDIILVTVYTPNSQSPESDRFRYRVRSWDVDFRAYMSQLCKKKTTIICGDFNVAHGDGDVYKPDEFRNRVAGFMNEERENFTKLLTETDSIDAFSKCNPNAEKAFTFWDQKLPYLRRTNRGWRIDYFLTPCKLPIRIKKCEHLPYVTGSDHCPISLEYDKLYKRRYRLKLTT